MTSGDVRPDDRDTSNAEREVREAFERPPAQLEREVELSQREVEERTAARQRELAGKEASDLSMGAGYDRIVDHLYDLAEPDAEYREIREALSFGARRAASGLAYGDLVDALDHAEDIAYRATLLLVNAKVAHDAYELDAKTIVAALRAGVIADLEVERARHKAAAEAAKKAKTDEPVGRSKQITEADIDAALAEKYPREWRDLEMRRGKARRMIAALESLEARTIERARDLRQMVARQRSD